MSKTQVLTLTSFVIFVVLSIVFDSWNNQTSHMSGYAKQIEDYLHPMEEEVNQLLSNKELIYRKIFEPADLNEEEQLQVLEDLEKLSERPFGLYFYKNDSLFFWSRSSVLPGDLKKIRQQVAANQSNLIRLPNGFYEFIESKDFALNITAAALIPVKNEFRLESSYLENWFLASDYIPWQVKISYTPTDYKIADSEGKKLFYLTAEQAFKDAPRQKWILFFYILASLSMAFFVNNIARNIVQKYRPWWGAAFLIVSVVFLRLLSFKLDFSEKFDNLAIFAKAFETPVLSYFLGDLLIDILLLLWLMVFFHREFKVKQLINISPPWQFLLTTLNYFSIILGILMVSSVFKSLVLDSGITFDFDNVFQLSVYSVLAIFGIIFLLFALFLFSHRMMLTIQKTGLKHKYRLFSQFAALLIALPVIWLTDLDLPIISLVLGVSLYILLFDLYIEIKNPSIIWLGIWLLFFSSFSAILLFKYNEDKDLFRRYEYAQALAKWSDKIAENELEIFADSLRINKNIRNILFDRSLTDSLRNDRLKKRINNIYADFKYLFNIYTYELSVSDKSSVFKSSFLGVDTPNDAEQKLTQKFSEYKKPDTLSIYYKTAQGENYSYLVAEEFRNLDAPDEKATLYVKASKKLRKASRVYTELILTQNFKNLNNLDFYEYAVYKNNKLIESTGSFYDEEPRDYLVDYNTELVYNETSLDGRSELVYQANNGAVVIIGRPIRSLLKPISLFSYLFVLLGITVISLALVNTFTRLLPQVLQLTFWRKPSLKNKIQLAVILTIIGSFIMIGWVTVVYFRQTSDEYHENRLLRKLGSVLKDAEHEIQLEMEASNKAVDLEKLVNAVSPIHRMDINVYDLKGDLVTSTEPDIYNKGIIAPKMGAVAYHALVRQNHNENIQSEKIGELDYKAAYVPLRQPNGQVMGYIGLPYYAKQRNLKDDVYEFMGTLLNVYVFLLLIASTIAIFVANSITRPISVIGDRFRRFKLGSPEPLKWDSKDELGELIKDYNRMLEKVSASTEIIKKSEREGAWRLMAQQVAHEIKNPLTPMKLSIQYLQHAIKNDPDNVQELFERVGRTLTEQIENLVQIATAFSNFAQMPKPDNKPLVLNELVDSVYLLNVENQAVEFSMFLPEEPITTVADKNQLRRVLNNIVSNAIQAIPEDRSGKVDISLFEKDGKAIIKVSDNGKGISEEMLGKVFQPHFTTRTSGMGLGLAMCKDMVELAGGTIYFKTVVGKGTDFFVELPKVKVKIDSDIEV